MKAPSVSDRKELNKTPIEIPSSAALSQAVAQARAARSQSGRINLDEIGAADIDDAALPPKEEPLARRTKPTPALEVIPPEVDTGDFEDPREETQKNRGMTVAVIFASAVALVAVGIVIYLTFFDKSDVLRPTVISNADGKSVTASLSFPDAPPGTMIQAMGVQLPLVHGLASLNIPMAAIKLGTNDINLLYIEPGEAPKQMSFPLVLRHIVTDDFFTAVFQTAPGVQLSVAGKRIMSTQTAQGVGSSYFHKINLSDFAETQVKNGDMQLYSIPFQLIDENGTVEPGVHTARVPMSKLQLDRPAASALLVSDTVVCSGSTEEGAQVTVNNMPVTVIAGAFTTTLPLVAPGRFLVTVVARAPGKAPRKIQVEVNRIESFAPVVAEWSKDLDPSLDYPTVSGDPKAKVGKKIKLTGRVVNIGTEKGVTAFILYVGKGCPAHSKCAVYVVFRGETEAALHSWVDVYGSVRGTQAVEMQNGFKIDMPAVDAAFVLPAENLPLSRSK